MSVEELAEELNLSVSTLTTSFPRTQKVWMKRGVYIRKKGRGASAQYFIEKLDTSEEKEKE